MKAQTSPAKADWLLGGHTWTAGVTEDKAHHELQLSNGLATRRFRMAPNVATVSFVNGTNGEQLVRSVTAEASVTLDGKTFQVGGLYGQKEKAYLREEWIDGLKGHKEDFQCTGWTTGPVKPLLHWTSRTWTANPHQPTGTELVFSYRCPDTAFRGIVVLVHYALYDNMPLLCKWLTIRNDGDRPVKVDKVVNEILATPEEQSAVGGGTDEISRPHSLYVESNYAFNGSMRYDLSDQTTHWLADSSYTTQVNYNAKAPCLLEIYPRVGPGVTLSPGDTLASVRSFELLMDSYDRERRGMAIRRMYRTVAPWTTQNPIFMHLVSHNDQQVYTAVDQCAATGYEALILSFGSHCHLEDTSAANVAKWKHLADYAHSKGILIGGYSLFSSRHISDTDDVINPKTGKPGGAVFGYAPCFASNWGLSYLAKLKYFLSGTGFDIFENDGPYAGDVCASTTHPGHRDLEDSQWKQALLQKSLYHWCNEHGIYVNAPDWYFLDGTNKTGLGYREMDFTLPRAQQIIINRQNIFDGTWEKSPSMGWGFVPLTAYHNGGPEAVLEPLKDHLSDYERLMIQYYGSGVQACYRGPRLFDTDSTKDLVTRTISWYKAYRDILNGDIIHLRRADGRDWDGIMHVDPKGAIKGFVLLYNPLPVTLERTISLPLYYTGLAQAKTVTVREGKELETNPGAAENYVPGKTGEIALKVVLPPGGLRWYTIQ